MAGPSGLLDTGKTDVERDDASVKVHLIHVYSMPQRGCYIGAAAFFFFFFLCFLPQFLSSNVKTILLVSSSFARGGSKAARPPPSLDQRTECTLV